MGGGNSKKSVLKRQKKFKSKGDKSRTWVTGTCRLASGGGTLERVYRKRGRGVDLQSHGGCPGVEGKVVGAEGVLLKT